MKLSSKIRDKLKNWLLKDELKELEDAKAQYKCLHNEYTYVNATLGMAQDKYANAYKLVDDCHKMMNSMIDVGADLGFYSDDHSWAVVCIKGHPEYVKFIPLSHQNARDVLEFLKRFRYSDRVVDSPLAFKNMVDHCIMNEPFGK